jgi:glycosyltransferase involved in cell wall biosynthesis
MPVYNTEKYVADAIKSVLNQTFRDFELIIINDASPDNSDRVIKQFRDKRIRYFKHKTNNGKCHANNFGIKKARGKYIQIFDSDDIMVNYKLDVQSQILDSGTKLGLVYGNAYKMDAKGNIYAPWNVPFPKKESITDKFNFNKFNLAKLRKRLFIQASTTLFTKKAVKNAGGFDEDLVIAEDWDMWLRIAEKFRVYYLPVPLILYRIHKGSLYQTAKRKGLVKYYNDLVMKKMRERMKR